MSGTEKLALIEMFGSFAIVVALVVWQLLSIRRDGRLAEEEKRRNQQKPH
jgi:hypothetical protein